LLFFKIYYNSEGLDLTIHLFVDYKSPFNLPKNYLIFNLIFMFILINYYYKFDILKFE